MTSTLLLLVPLLLAADPMPKATEAVTLDRKGQLTLFGGDYRVKWTRTEFLLDIDPNPPGTAGPMKARMRLILTPYTAKRLRMALSTTIERHEAVFGAVEAPEKKGRNDEAALGPDAAVVYTNYCRVASTPEEVFLEFGLSEDPFGTGPKVVSLPRRVVLTHSGCKGMLARLTKAIAGYEDEHGVIELDVRKRAKQRPEP